MNELDSAIVAAWDRIRPLLQSNPDELAARLARRRSPLLLRPPRAWCLAVRASDRRLDEHFGSRISHFGFPQSEIPHRKSEIDRPSPCSRELARASARSSPHPITLTAALLRHLCHPITIPAPGIKPGELARLMGCHIAAISALTRKGHLQVVHNESKWYGPRGRCLYTPRLLDPSNFNGRRPPDPLWGSLAPRIVQLIPDDFEQTLTRVPTFVGGARFSGHRWLCPACSNPVQIVYYPMRLLSIPEFLNQDLTQLKEVDDPQPPPPTFACVRCHGVRYFSRCDGRASWGHLIAYATAGLLYGHEVPRPERAQRVEGTDSNTLEFLPERRRAYRPRKNRAPSQRRQQILDRLLNGMTYTEIALDLRIARSNVHKQVVKIYKQHEVTGREALAKKLGHELPKGRSPKRDLVAAKLKEGKKCKQIAAETGLTRAAVHQHIKFIRREQRVDISHR